MAVNVMNFIGLAFRKRRKEPWPKSVARTWQWTSPHWTVVTTTRHKAGREGGREMEVEGASRSPRPSGGS